MDKRKRETKIENPLKVGLTTLLETMVFVLEVTKEHHTKIFIIIVWILSMTIAFIIHVFKGH